MLRKSKASVLSGSRAGRLSVLLLIRQHTDLLWIRKLLTGQDDLRLYWCNSVPMMMDVMRRRHYDIVLWEEHLFESDQASFLRMMAEYAQAPVIAVGSSRNESHIRQLIMKGADDYLAKGELRPALLIRAIRRARYRELARSGSQLREQMDSLTGILDRHLFYDRLHQAMLRAQRGNRQVGLLFLNIDHFRTVNQTLGYKNGDLLIKMVAARIRQVLRQCDGLARVGGDEFAVILEDVEEEFSLSAVADKVIEVFHKPFQVSHRDVELNVSIGLANYPEEGHSVDLLLQHANQAMFDAKKEPGSAYRFFDEARNRDLKRRLELEADLRQAIRGNQLEVYHQPKIEVSTGRIIGMEALVRWPHPKFGMLAPQTFIPMAEQSSLIIPMGYWVLQQTCQDLSELQRRGFEHLQCSVNLSFRQFHDRKLSETVFRIIYNADIDTTGFEFELTESAVMYDREYTMKCLKELAHMGISFSLDDFGTGYSSFSNLRSLPISSVKIDKSFIERLPSSSQDQTLVAGMISLAHNLSMQVVAEGVETPEQLEFLRRHHCDYAQGYLIAKPMTFTEFSDFLVQSRPVVSEAHPGAS
ncbi:putative bifunctional diguanylate cyclase/phosphodiesterase [Hahella ganghwensis]|uniref:putative bifunctional diguanylate cyclase/phosphodiesterase n=1 Tax=Hahella ganghwensis TaxID=286420 RepID=UPI0003800DF5|nr:EAL domain-containing protein [Hahella ganghwensis]